MKNSTFMNKLFAAIITTIAMSVVLVGNVKTVEAATTSEIENLVYGGHSYRYISESMKWDEAKAYCEKFGGHLVTITSAEENKALFEYLQKYCSTGTDVMIGMSDAEKEGDWSTWANGEQVTYTNWGTPQPDDKNGTRNYAYICMGERKGSSYNIQPGQWDDGKGTGVFVCEWDVESNLYIPEDAMIYDGHSYKAILDGMKWEDAKLYCELLGGHLATITSKKENTAVYTYLKKHIESNQDVFIGLSDAEKEGDWKTWVTGEKVKYTNWGKGEPDNRYGAQNYAAICMGERKGSSYLVKAGQWDDIKNCNAYFVCEWDTVNDNLEKGTIFTDSKTNATYKITAQDKTVEYTATFDKSSKSITIANTVKLKGTTYKVTTIKSSALKSNKKVTKLTIGKNVKKIGAKAFYKCKNLKTVKINSKGITSIGKNAFTGINKNAQIKVPKSKLNKYKQLLKKAKVAKTVKIKK